MRPQSAIETHPLATRVKVVVIQLNQRQIDRLPVFKENPSKDRLKIDSNVIAQEEELKRKRRDHMKQKYDLLLNDYRCADMRPHQNVDAGILMFKLLARKEEEFNPDQAADYRRKNLVSRLKVWLPDTIVYHDLENHFWLYSNEACVVWRTDRVTVKNVTSKLSNFCSQNELVGVIKSEKYTSVTKTKLLTAQELGYTVQGVQSSGADKSRVVIQRYIKSIGSKAFKVRTVWKRGQPPYCFILTNKSSYYEYDGVQDIYKYMVVPDARGQNCTIFKTNKGKQLTDTLPYVENIVKYFRGGFGVEVLQIAADFIKDESGIWWMINIKSVVLKERISEARIKKVVNGEEDEDTYKETQVKVYRRPEGYQKIKLCRYCEMPFHSEDLTKKMTLKMVIELDKHLKYRGYQFDWLDRSERQFLDTSNLYEVHKVCKVCYQLYQEMVELNRHFEKFARHVGIPIMMDRNGQIVSITTLKKKNIPNLDNPFGHQEDTKEVAENHTGEHSESQYEKQIEESEHQEFDEEFDGWKVEELNRNPSPAEMGTLPISQTDFLQQKSSFQSSFRFIFFIQCINDIPVYQMRTHPPETYWIEVEVLDQVLRYKIEPQYIQIDSAQPHFCRIDLNRCSVKYFFSNKRIGLQRYINEAKKMTMRLKCNDKVKYSKDIELQDFISEQVPTRNYQKYFAVEVDHLRKLSWEVVFSVGVHEGSEVDVSGMILKRYKGLLIPPPAYYSYEPLPETWQKILDRDDVRNPIDWTPEMEEFSKAPLFKKDSVAEGSRSLAHAQQRNSISKRRYDAAEDGESEHRGRPKLSDRQDRMSNVESDPEDYDNMEEDQGPHAKLSRSNQRPNYSSQENPFQARSQHSISVNKKHWKSQENYSAEDKNDQTDGRTEAGDETQLKASQEYFHSPEDDAFLMDELANYNSKLNLEVSRILNEPREKA